MRLRLREPRDAISWLLFTWSDSLTVPLKPFMLFKPTVKIPEEPGLKERDPGFMFSVKLVIVRGIVTRWVICPLWPLMVML